MKVRTLVIVFFFSLISYSQSVDVLAKEFITYLDVNVSKAYADYLDETFKAKVKESQLENIWKQLEGAYGNFIIGKFICIDSIGENKQVFIDCKFEKSSLIINSVFNSSKKIVGFFIVAEASCEKKEYLNPSYVKQKRFNETEMSFRSENYKMFGSLVLPKKMKPKTPIFIFVHGSGPNDRDETIGPNKIFKDLAYGLATKGIASLRYDKRTYLYKDSINGKDIHKEVLNDVSSAIKWIKSQTEFKDSPILIIGHSLGAYLAPLIAKQNIEVKGIVMLAGNCRPLEDLIKEQFHYLFHLSSKSSVEMSDEIINIEKKYVYIKNNLSKNSPTNKLPLNIPASYWLSMKLYDQKDVISKLMVPIFVLQGERDYQVTMTDFELWNNTMKDKANYSSKAYKKLNHLFLEGEGKLVPAEYMNKSNVPKYIIEDIFIWLKKQNNL